MPRVKAGEKRREKRDAGVPVRLEVVGENINGALGGLARPISKLKPDPRNARKHSPRSIESIKESLASFGQQKPIVILKGGTVIAGNGTLEAARQLGWKRLACVEFADEERARAYALADNRAAELSAWDVDELLDQLKELPVAPACFTEGEVQDLLDQQQNPYVAEKVDVESLKAHPRNYRAHPEDQLVHIMQSIQTNGFYRSVVVARDYTILAGHGVVLAAQRLGKKRIPVIRLDVDPDSKPALKVVVADNEIGKLAETDDRALTELLKEIMKEDSENLVGTGFDQQQLAALAFVTRPSSEFRDMNEAAEWVGLPEYESGSYPIGLRVNFKSEEDRERFVKEYDLRVEIKGQRLWTFRWPYTENEDKASLRFEDGT